ncbi:MAG: leucyl aminopeptidase [Myxococcales bacterium]|nr:MAG: leucyl aminopeptidase [Myxococcales bacterium]
MGSIFQAAKKDESLAQLDRMSSGALKRVIAEEGFKGSKGQILQFQFSGKGQVKRIILVGLGAAKVSSAHCRTIAVRTARHARRFTSIALILPQTDIPAVRAAAEGLLGGSYLYDRYFSESKKPKTKLNRAVLLVDKSQNTPELERALQEGAIIGGAVNFARDLVNCPPNDLTPTALADAAKQACDQVGAKCKIYNKKEIQNMGMNLLLAVNRGSAQEPRFVHMSYKPAQAKKRIVFVGKGITFDAGGLCIKPSKAMLDMKCDMAGAAVTIGVVVAAAALRLPVEVHGLVASTENMTGADAYRPGDVFTAKNGKTVEIINTDAEGRLVLADALSYADELEPDLLIDHATLTGACMVALGPRRAGFFSNSDDIAQSYIVAAEQQDEMYWRMPLDTDLRELLKSSIADMKHCDGPYGGTITAALFLKEFIGKNKWVHVDIAGPAFLETMHGDTPKGGTGFGIRTALEYLRSIA